MPSGSVVIDDVLQRRQQAIRLFVDNPLLAKRRYPDLIDGLCTFFIQSSNPHTAHDGGKPPDDYQFEKWEMARHWALLYKACGDETSIQVTAD